VLLFFGQGMATSAMIQGAGGIDVGVESGVRGAIPVTPEALVAADPEILVLPEAGFQALGGEAALDTIPGFSQTTAGQDGNFLVYDEAYFFNLGPRVGQALKEFVQDLYPSGT
jgi:iron complex transport system substrate-binding protein